jgi:hypothetical protein
VTQLLSSFDLLGLPVLFGTADPAVADAVLELFDPFRTTVSTDLSALDVQVVSGTQGWTLEIGRWPMASAASWHQLLPPLITELNQRCVGALRDFAVHAGVVAHADEAIAFPGESGLGKSTAVAACVRAGYDYVSDEALVLESDAQVRPYPRPVSLVPRMATQLGLSIREPDADEVMVAPGELGSVWSGSRLAVAHVVMLDRGGSEGLVALPRADVVPLLLRNSFNHFLDPAASIRLAAHLARTATCWRLGYSEPAEVAVAVTELFDGRSVSADEV